VREKYVNNSAILDTTSADEFGDTYINQNKDAIKSVKITVNNNYKYDYYQTFDDL